MSEICYIAIDLKITSIYYTLGLKVGGHLTITPIRGSQSWTHTIVQGLGILHNYNFPPLKPVPT